MPTVYLSPSVQEFNTGVSGYGTEEQRMNQIADVVQYELDRHGITVFRNTPDNTLRQIVEASNAIGPDIHVAIHSNASENPDARGPEVYVHRFGMRSQQLAEDIYQSLSAITPAKGLGVKEGRFAFSGKGYYELRYTAAPAVLVEVSFHDHPDDAVFIIEHIYEIGVAIAQGILTYFGIPYRSDTQVNMDYLRNKYNGHFY